MVRVSLGLCRVRIRVGLGLGYGSDVTMAAIFSSARGPLTLSTEEIPLQPHFRILSMALSVLKISASKAPP